MKVFEHPNGSFIENDGGGRCFIFNVKADEYTVRFNVDYIPAGEWEWFCGVVGGQIISAVQRAVIATEHRVKRNIRKAIGL